MDKEVKQKTFQTPDTPLAVWLYISGKRLVKVDTSQHSAVFIFEQDGDNSFDILVSQWENGIAIGNVGIFFRTYRNFIKKIKDNSDV